MSSFDERDLPTEDEGEGVRRPARSDGDDVEGHIRRPARADEEGEGDEGEGVRRPAYTDGDDVEGHIRMK
jgi:hypothetical protein